MKERIIDSWVSSLIGVGLILLAIGFIRLDDKVTASVLVAAGLGLVAKKDAKG